MAATRLSLSMDDSVVERARRLAEARHTSISKLFVSFVCMMEAEAAGGNPALPPLTKKALGLAKDAVGADCDYRESLSDALVQRHGGES